MFSVAVAAGASPRRPGLTKPWGDVQKVVGWQRHVGHQRKALKNPGDQNIGAKKSTEHCSVSWL